MTIELLDPREIEPNHPELWKGAGWSYMLDYNWMINNCLVHGGTNILDVGYGRSPLGRFIADKLGANYTPIDRAYGQEFLDYDPETAPDIIMWVSSLEHNFVDEMNMLYIRSMKLLAPGGLFLATIAISPVTHWFEPSAQINLSPDDAMAIFDETEIVGNYKDIHKAYRDDTNIAARYARRYGHWNEADPVFIGAGVRKIKYNV